MTVAWAATLSTPATAQTRSGAVIGAITDSAGAPVADALVAVRHSATGLERTATTGAGGRYVVENLPPGVYAVTAFRAGLQAATATGQGVFVGTTTTADLQLGLAGLTEQVVVSAESTPLVDSTKSEVGQVIRRAEVD